MKIKKITRVPYKGKVHNFGTPPVHTYYANGVLVHNCYTNATGRGSHMTPAQLETIITGFHKPPYQMAFGGGSPTSHPDFTTLLSLTAELGVVPNYTTEGEGLTPAILDATKRYCGGVALTFHRRKNETLEQTADRFVDRYQLLKDAGINQVNIHVIAGKNLLEDLRALLVLSETLGPLNIVLLAYYPSVGRDDGTGFLSIVEFDRDLPPLIKSLEENKNIVSYSQGLLPYFKSRPELGKATHTHRMEGFTTAAINVNGFMTASSFIRRDIEKAEQMAFSAFNVPSQLLWLMTAHNNVPTAYDCGNCNHKRVCGGSSEETHMDLCAYLNTMHQLRPESAKPMPEVTRTGYYSPDKWDYLSDWLCLTQWRGTQEVSQYAVNQDFESDPYVRDALNNRYPGIIQERITVFRQYERHDEDHNEDMEV